MNLINYNNKYSNLLKRKLNIEKELLRRLRHKKLYFKNKYFPELENCALIRELHVYGQVASTKNKEDKNKAQNLGFGKQLMRKAERISYNNSFNKIAVISGVGVRDYYRRLDYKLENTFMIKNVNKNVNCILIAVINILFNLIIYYLFIKLK